MSYGGDDAKKAIDKMKDRDQISPSNAESIKNKIDSGKSGSEALDDREKEINNEIQKCQKTGGLDAKSKEESLKRDLKEVKELKTPESKKQKDFTQAVKDSTGQ